MDLISAIGLAVCAGFLGYELGQIRGKNDERIRRMEEEDAAKKSRPPFPKMHPDPSRKDLSELFTPFAVEREKLKKPPDR
jgi:hypothetical protein